MDPNALLEEIRSHYGDDTELAYLIEDLDEWLTKRGFLPRDWER